MIRIFFLLFLFSIPAVGFAQRVTVRSGEHADFSRLAFEFSGQVDWEMGRVEQGYEIRLQGVSSEIDISKVFRRIPRDRIKDLSVSADNRRITLDLGCDCHADAFEFRPGLLVVDVKDGPPLVASRFETVFGSDELVAGQHTIVEVPKEILPSPTESTRDRPAAVILPLRLPTVHATANPLAGLFVANSKERAQRSTEQVSEMQSEIFQQIGHAASQGLLDANISNSVRVEKSDHATGEATTQPHPTPIAEPHINIHIESSIDREFESFLRQNLMTDNGEKCLPEALFNVSEWGDTDSVFAGISEYRRQVSGEFDKIDPLAVQSLVKAYIYAGFGAEALGVLSSFDVVLEEESTLKAMASIVDGITTESHAELSKQLGCDSSSALWGALFAPSLSRKAQINTVSILGTFSGLPVHLRRLLGPGLAQKFVKSGDVETARAIRNAIARAPGEAGAEFHLLDAQLDIERGMKDSAEHKLEDIIIRDQGVAPRALIELLEVRLQKGEDIDPQILETVESYIFEQQDTKTAADLKHLIVLSLAQAGDFLEALDALNELEAYESLDEKQKALTWEKVVDHLAAKAPEAMLLQFVFAAQDKLVHQDISRQTRRKLASRLLKEGWPIKAEMILAAPVSPTADDRIILARAGVLKGQTDYVLKMLENVAGDEAAQVRALAYERSGEYLAAAQEYRRLKDGENQKSATWRAEDWAQLEVIGSESEQTAAKVMLSQDQFEDEATPTVSGTIAYDRFLLSKSEEERQFIERLLEEYPGIRREES